MCRGDSQIWYQGWRFSVRRIEMEGWVCFPWSKGGECGADRIMTRIDKVHRKKLSPQQK